MKAKAVIYLEEKWRWRLTVHLKNEYSYLSDRKMQSKVWGLHEFPRAALTKCHKLSDLNLGSTLSHSSIS